MSFLLCLSISALPLVAEELGNIALAVLDDKATIDTELAPALQASDPAVRAVAARAAATRSRIAILPAIEEQSLKETNAETARELARALVLLGGKDKVDAALALSARFDHRLDGAVASAVARLGTADALEIYTSKLRNLHATPRSNFFQLALWGSPQLVNPTAARVLGERDPRSWDSFLTALKDSGISLDPGIVIAAIRDRNDEIRARTIRMLFDDVAQQGRQMTPRIRDLVLEPDDREGSDSISTAFALEILRRVAGRERHERPEFLEYLNSINATGFIKAATLSQLTKSELAALEREHSAVDVKDGVRTLPGKLVRLPDFYLPGDLPARASNAILQATGCRSEYIGLLGATVDRQGRVTSLDTSKFEGDSHCLRAVAAMARLSLVVNQSINSRQSTDSIVLVKARKADVCLDESPVPAAGEIDFESCSPKSFTAIDSSNCRPPKVRRRIEPAFPERSRKAMHSDTLSTIVVEALITREGCIRNVYVISQSPIGDLNRAALFAVSQWLFDPGIIDGRPASVLFNLSVNFRTTR